MKLNIFKKYHFLKFWIYYFLILMLIISTKSFKFSLDDDDDLIIKFNVENVKNKNNEHLNKIKSRVRKEMKSITKRLTSHISLPDDLEDISTIKVYELQNNTNNNKNNENLEGDDFLLNDFEENDIIKSKLIIYIIFLLFVQAEPQ